MRRGLPLVLVLVLFAGVLPLAARVSPARAATPTRATIEATQFQVVPNATGEDYAVCPAGKRGGGGGGVVQSGTANLGLVHASGPLDNTGTTLETNDGDVAKQWYAAVQHYKGGVVRTFRVFAICE